MYRLFNTKTAYIRMAIQSRLIDLKKYLRLKLGLMLFRLTEVSHG